MSTTFIAYMLFISVISAVVFMLDKYKAKRAKWRIPEMTLHTLEALGGVFIILFLMYNIRHKNAKTTYFVKTYLILACWLLGLGFWAYKQMA